jgi:hypothetical protein
MSPYRTAAWILPAVLMASCAKAPPPPPDGSCGVQGVCLLEAEPAGDDGRVPDRRPWAGVRVNAREENNPDGNDPHTYSAVTDESGRFRIALRPGRYSVGVHDPDRLAGKMHSPVGFRVEPGKYAEVVLDWDKMHVRDIPGR